MFQILSDEGHVYTFETLDFLYEGDIGVWGGGLLWTAIPGNNRKIPQYRVENSMNTETAWMDKTKYRTEAAKLPKYCTKNTIFDNDDAEWEV